MHGVCLTRITPRTAPFPAKLILSTVILACRDPTWPKCNYCISTFRLHIIIPGTLALYAFVCLLAIYESGIVRLADNTSARSRSTRACTSFRRVTQRRGSKNPLKTSGGGADEDVETLRKLKFLHSQLIRWPSTYLNTPVTRRSSRRTVIQQQ